MPTHGELNHMSYSVSHEFLQEKLLNAGATGGASEAHGILCGTISSAGKALFQDWVRQVLGQAPVSGDVLMAEIKDLLEDVFVESETGLASDLYEFEMLLPDDDLPLTERVHALGEWCDGYLLGFSAGCEIANVSVPVEVDDVIKDFVEFSKVDDKVDEASELDEQALMEVIEYIRTSVLNVLETLNPDGLQV